MPKVRNHKEKVSIFFKSICSPVHGLTAWVLPHYPSDKIDSDFDEIACQTRTHLVDVAVLSYVAVVGFVAVVESCVVDELPVRKSVPSAALTRAKKPVDRPVAGRPSSSARAVSFWASPARARFSAAL